MAEATPDVAPQHATATTAGEIVAHGAWGFDVQIVPAWSKRAWMDATDKGFAYHCLPMLLANQSGWFVLAPHGAIAEWNGGPDYEDLKVEIVGRPHAVHAMSRVGSGILSWTIPYVFRTPPGWNMLCRGPANYVKDGIAPLEGLVETDWTNASFSANWKMSRPGRVEFEAGEPIAMLVPHRRGDLEQFEARKAPLNENPALAQGYHEWISSRRTFLMAQARGEERALKDRFEKHYFNGTSNDGRQFDDHQKKRVLATFVEPALDGESGASTATARSEARRDPRGFIAYELHDPEAMAIAPAHVQREWMDATDNRFAYRCLPLSIANQSGWIMRCPLGFTATWNGGKRKEDTAIVLDDGRPFDPRVKSHFGAGVVTFGLPYFFRTPPGVNLWVKGPSNYFKDGAQALEAVVETDWSVAPFTMNWKCTRPGHPVHFDAAEPICMLVPMQRGLAESLNPRCALIDEDPSLAQSLEAWERSRGAFIEGLERGDASVRARGWERHYLKGTAPDGTSGNAHQTNVKLKPFKALRAPPPAPPPRAGRGREADNDAEPLPEPSVVIRPWSDEISGPPFPEVLGELDGWAERARTTRADAERRLMHYAAICSVAADEKLCNQLVLRGAGALWLAYSNNRTTDDLDFIALKYDPEKSPAGTRERMAARVGSALSTGMRRYFPAFGEWRARLLSEIKVEVSPCYTDPGHMAVALNRDGLMVRVADLEYLLAEKLVAMIQQINSRGKRRRYDALDITLMLRRHGSGIDRAKTARYLRARCRSDPQGKISLAAFDQTVREQTERGHVALAGTLGPQFIPFEQAWESVLTFVNQLEHHGLDAEP
jgi:hypothetical protein